MKAFWRKTTSSTIVRPAEPFDQPMGGRLRRWTKVTGAT